MSSGSKRLLNLGSKLLSLALAAWLIWWVIAKGGANMKEEWRQCDSSSLLLAFFLSGVGSALSSYRWSRLLAVQGVILSAWDAIKLTMIGVFFNVAIPGGVGGDIVKIYKLQSQAGERFPEAVSTTLFDRVLGLLGLFLVAILAVAFSWGFLSTTDDKTIQYTVSFVFSVAVVGALGVLSALYYELLYQIPGVLAMVNIGRRICPPRIWNILSHMVQAIALFRTHLREIVIALAISMIIHTSTALAMCAIGNSFHAPVLQVRDYFLATQIANTISAVPITPGGLGARDSVLLVFFHAAGEGSKAGVIPPIYSLIVILWSLIGSLFYFAERKHIHVNLTSPSPAPQTP